MHSGASFLQRSSRCQSPCQFTVGSRHLLSFVPSLQGTARRVLSVRWWPAEPQTRSNRVQGYWSTMLARGAPASAIASLPSSPPRRRKRRRGCSVLDPSLHPHQLRQAQHPVEVPVARGREDETRQHQLLRASLIVVIPTSLLGQTGHAYLPPRRRRQPIHRGCREESETAQELTSMRIHCPRQVTRTVNRAVTGRKKWQDGRLAESPAPHRMSRRRIVDLPLSGPALRPVRLLTHI